MMRTIIAMAAAFLWTATCAAAFEAGIGVGVGGIGGIGASVGSDGSASAGASVGGVSVGVGTDSGVDAPGGVVGEDEAPASAPVQGPMAAANNRSSDILLPRSVCPRNSCGNTSARGVRDDPGAVPAIEGTPPRVLEACRATVARAAQSYGMVNVTVASYGQTRQLAGGGWAAPVFTRVTYEREGGVETRQAPILCQLDEAGVVSGLDEIAGRTTSDARLGRSRMDY